MNTSHACTIASLSRLSACLDCQPVYIATLPRLSLAPKFPPKKINSSCRLLDRRLAGKMLGLENDRYRWPRPTETFHGRFLCFTIVFRLCVSKRGEMCLHHATL